jgi:hypothetical protein
MSNFEKLTALGAQVVGGDLIWKHKVLGHFRNGDLHLTADGTAALDIEDAQVKEPTPAPVRGLRAARKKVEAPNSTPDPIDTLEIQLLDE